MHFFQEVLLKVYGYVGKPLANGLRWLSQGRRCNPKFVTDHIP